MKKSYVFFGVIFISLALVGSIYILTSDATGDEFKLISFSKRYKGVPLYKMGKDGRTYSVAFLGEISSNQNSSLVRKLRALHREDINYFDIRERGKSIEHLPGDFYDVMNFVAPEIFVVHYGQKDFKQSQKLREYYKGLSDPTLSYTEFVRQQIKESFERLLKIASESSSKLIFLGYNNDSFSINPLFRSLVDNENVFYVDGGNVENLDRAINEVISQTDLRPDRRDQWSSEVVKDSN